MIHYQEEKCIENKELGALYDSVGWSTYTKNLDKLERALQQSLRVLTAWEDQQLIGLIRVIGDGETILYIQDLLVQPSYQRRGIGRTLINQVLEKYPDVRQKVLMTDDTLETRSFYESCGFHAADDKKAIAFYKFDY